MVLSSIDAHACIPIPEHLSVQTHLFLIELTHMNETSHVGTLQLRLILPSVHSS